MGEKITPAEASERAFDILSSLKGGTTKEEPVDPSFILYLTEIIVNRGTTGDAPLSMEMVNDIIAAMMKHGVDMHDWPRIIAQLVKTIHAVILYNIPDVYREKAAELASDDLKAGFDATRDEYLTIMGVK
jgi:hypothetical protein